MFLLSHYITIEFQLYISKKKSNIFFNVFFLHIHLLTLLIITQVQFVINVVQLRACVPHRHRYLSFKLFPIMNCSLAMHFSPLLSISVCLQSAAGMLLTSAKPEPCLK